jgi:signal transduction histidine kinase
MISTSRLWGETISGTERVLDLALSPRIIWFSVLFYCSALILLSFMLPTPTLATWPAMVGQGQNALLALTLFAIWQCADSVVADKQFLPILLIPAALAAVVIVQSLVSWFPQDGWLRFLVNTAPAPQAWPGRMSAVEAYMLLTMFSAALLLRLRSSWGVIFSGFSIGFISLVTAVSVAAYFSGISEPAPYIALHNTVNPMFAGLLFLLSLAMARTFVRHPDYLRFEADNPGFSVFLKVAALIALLLVASATAASGYALQGKINAGIIVLMLLSLITLLIIYVNIVATVDERRRVEIALREREAALRKAQSLAHVGSWRLFLPEGVLEWSDECCVIFGETPGRKRTLNDFMSFVHPEDLEMVRQSWNAALEGNLYDIEHRIIVGWKTKWVRERADFQWQDNKRKCICLGTVQDITDSKNKEMELLRSRNLIRKLAAHNEKIKEQERTRIARELHDEMGQHLTVLRLKTAMVQSSYGGDNTKLYDELKDIKGEIDNTIEVVRSVAASLRPPALEAGLIAACSWLLENYVEKAGIATRLESTIDDATLSDEIKTAALRILQESLTNVIRHSNATEVLVWIALHNHELVISVTDNGDGFSPGEPGMDMHFGLVGIEERALSFGGKVAIQTAPGKGCCISVTLSLWCV